MQIGFDAKRAFLNTSGLGNYSRTLIQNFSESHPQHNCFLYTPAVNSRYRHVINKSNIHIKTPSPHLFPFLWRSFSLTEELEKDRLDIYHGLSHELPFNIKKTKIKTVLTIHDLIFLRYPQWYSFFDRKVYELKYKYSCRNADKIIAISEQSKQDIIHYFDIAPEKIQVLYQTCHTVFKTAASAEQMKHIRKKYALPEEFILHVGSITERKNLINLARAINLLTAK